MIISFAVEQVAYFAKITFFFTYRNVRACSIFAKQFVQFYLYVRICFYITTNLDVTTTIERREVRKKRTFVRKLLSARYHFTRLKKSFVIRQVSQSLCFISRNATTTSQRFWLRTLILSRKTSRFEDKRLSCEKIKTRDHTLSRCVITRAKLSKIAPIIRDELPPRRKIWSGAYNRINSRLKCQRINIVASMPIPIGIWSKNP